MLNSIFYGSNSAAGLWFHKKEISYVDKIIV